VHLGNLDTVSALGSPTVCLGEGKGKKQSIVKSRDVHNSQ